MPPFGFPVNKAKFLEKTREVCTQLAWVNRAIQDLSDTYIDRSYGNTEPIVETDLAQANMTSEQLAGFVALAVQFSKFMNGQAVTPADHSVAVNQLRTDI